MTGAVGGERPIGSGEAVVRPAVVVAVGAEDLVPLIPTLLAAARYLVSGDAEARDLTQACLEIALRRLHQLRDPEKLRPWLLTILAREAMRLRRRLRRVVAFDPVVHDLQAPAPAPSDERDLAVRQALAGLPRRMRAAVILHHLVGLTVAETAGAMHVSENTVKSELKAGLRRLREGLDDRND